MLNYDNRQNQLCNKKFSIINKLLGYQSRIDLGNSFLADVGTYLSDSEYHYKMDHQFYETKL
jgi:hypothetical protein